MNRHELKALLKAVTAAPADEQARAAIQRLAQELKSAQERVAALQEEFDRRSAYIDELIRHNQGFAQRLTDLENTQKGHAIALTDISNKAAFERMKD